MGSLREATLRLAESHPELQPLLMPLLGVPTTAANRSSGAGGPVTSKTAAPPSEVGQIILQQMGGPRRLVLMLGIRTGFYNVGGGKGVGFSWPNRERSKGNTVEVELTPADTYDVRFYNVSGSTKKLVREYTNIYSDMLVEIFERQTGWYLRL